jgi:hypothetical protein
MVTVNENIRFYKPNDPYFYEVDNLPLIDLLENDKTLAAAINDILLSQSNFATEEYVQDAIGDSTQIDINGDNITLPNNVIDWVLQQGYGQGTLESLTDTDLTGISDGDVLVFDSGTFTPNAITGSEAIFLTDNYYLIGSQPTGEYPDSFDSAENFYGRIQSTGGPPADSDGRKSFIFTATLAAMGIPLGAKSILYRAGLRTVGSNDTDAKAWLYHNQGIQPASDGTIPPVMLKHIWGQGGSDTGQNHDTESGEIFREDPDSTELVITFRHNVMKVKSSSYPAVFFYVYGYTL